MDDRLERFLRIKLREAGKKYAKTRESADRQMKEAKEAYRNAHDAVLADLPQDEHGRAKIVCRRHVERRAVRLDTEGRPACFDAEHPACDGCVEDIRERTIETW
ncbi:DUF7091 family protein [Haladaptatus caseinilyticus]|uniref:DUF7091 family protein n=1 Tax=Haladaptatus caseinilyticus TaxID=2993314 RepID=UPI00224AEE6C|nr:hypothetical protein [Haladaptatus caseinilyticus]